jgi:peptide/nickel transport system permease protein
MPRFLLRRLLWALPSFIGITFAVFALVKAAPGDVVSSQGDLGMRAGGASASALADYRHQLGLDEPFMRGYLRWLSRLARLDLGSSLKDGRPVSRKLSEALPVTLALSSLALALTYLVAVPAGIYAALRPGTLVDRALASGLYLLYSLPVPWVSVLLIVCFGSGLQILPIQGLRSQGQSSFPDLAAHLVLPVICLSYGGVAVVSRYVRSAMLEVLGQDFVRAARARGLPERTVVFKHALRMALTSVATLLGFAFPAVVGGAVVVEHIFGLPGMGRLSLDAVLSRDLPVMMGTTSLAAVLTVLGFVVSDLLCAALDPRIALDAE